MKITLTRGFESWLIRKRHAICFEWANVILGLNYTKVPYDSNVILTIDFKPLDETDIIVKIRNEGGFFSFSSRIGTYSTEDMYDSLRRILLDDFGLGDGEEVLLCINIEYV